MNATLPLADRKHAGRLLAHRLQHLAGHRPLVLALPRGGVPVAFEIAQALEAELDLLMVRKLGAPGHAEFAIGAIVDGLQPRLVLNDEAIAAISPSREYVIRERDRQLAELERRKRMYLGDRPAPSLEGRTVILVDDGIATGSTVKAALLGIRQSKPEKLILAVPVAPSDSLDQLRSACDEIVVLATPQPFYSVGQHYLDFRQVEDREVMDLLARARARDRVGD